MGSEWLMIDCGTSTKGLWMKRNEKGEGRDEGKEREPAQAPANLFTVLASAPGIAEQSLRATLESLPSVRVIGTAAGCLSALQMVYDMQPDLIVIDSNLPFEDVQELLRQLKQEGLGTRSLVLSATSSQLRRALVAGADAALRRDASFGQLSAVVDGLHRGRAAEMEGAQP